MLLKLDGQGGGRKEVCGDQVLLRHGLLGHGKDLEFENNLGVLIRRMM